MLLYQSLFFLTDQLTQPCHRVYDILRFGVYLIKYFRKASFVFLGKIDPLEIQILPLCNLRSRKPAPSAVRVGLFVVSFLPVLHVPGAIASDKVVKIFTL